MKKQTKLGLVLAAAAVISVSVASLVSARGWVQNGADWYYVDNSGEYVTESIQSSGNSKFYLGEDGTMQRDYFLEEYNNNAYYFGQNGAMVTNTWVAIESSRVENQEDYIPDNYWYYFQASGKAMKAASGSVKKTTIDGKKYAFNEYGQMLTGWIAEGKVVGDDEENPFAEATYYAGGDNDGVLRSGWLTYYDGYDGDDYQSEYTNLYFYFNPSNNTKTDNRVKKINGRSYAFDQYGIMNSGWDVYDYLTGLNDNRVSYFSGEDDGHQVKKGWVFAVPAADLDCKAYGDDEEKYMYFNSSGEILRDQYKRINGKYYVFNRSGIMETGLVLWVPEGYDIGTGANADTYRFLETLDMDWQNGEDLAKKGLLRYGSDGDEYFFVNAYGQVDTSTRVAGTRTKKVSNFPDNTIDGSKPVQVKIHNYGSDGARKTGTNNVEFADDTYVFNTNSNGDKGSGIFAKKYYSLGIQLKASADIKYGIYNNASPSTTLQDAFGEPLTAQAYKDATNNNKVNDGPYRNALRDTKHDSWKAIHNNHLLF
jgi:glucan-binding YG repeat protein